MPQRWSKEHAGMHLTVGGKWHDMNISYTEGGRPLEGQAQWKSFSSWEKESTENSPQSCRANRMWGQLGFTRGECLEAVSADQANPAREISCFSRIDSEHLPYFSVYNALPSILCTHFLAQTFRKKIFFHFIF